LDEEDHQRCSTVRQHNFHRRLPLFLHCRIYLGKGLRNP
jgi:hypothetical protein